MMRRYPSFKVAGEALAAEAACSREAAFVAVRLGTGALTGRAFVGHVVAAAARAGVALGVKR
jgi:hypothetical protein